MDGFTIVEYKGEHSRYRCGYCGDWVGKISHGMPTHAMNVIDYQTLIDRGWRRSGKYCYKPAMELTCCPQYTIRCRALDFKMTKSRRKVLNKMKKFLLSEGEEEMDKWKRKFDPSEKPGKSSKTQLGIAKNDEARLTSDAHAASNSEVKSEQAKVELKRELKKGLGADPLKPPCKKAKALRLEKKKEKMLHTTENSCLLTPSEGQCVKTLKEQIPHLNFDHQFKRKLEVRTVRAKVGDPTFEATRKESHAVYQKYQQVIHGDHPLHCGERQWLRFLVNSTLHRDADGPGPGYGNYHQQYVLDGKIIAVGVVDILPNCLSSVYLYYDPDYGFLSLGIYSALSEIAYTQSLHQESDSLRYYYMGFYIHSCRKMRYKGEFFPSDLLCPETYDWVPLDLCKPVLDKKKYSRLNILAGGSEDCVDPHRGDNFNLNDLGVFYGGTLMNYELYRRLKYPLLCHEGTSGEEIQLGVDLKKESSDELVELKEYVSLVGDVCAKRMYLSRY